MAMSLQQTKDLSDTIYSAREQGIIDYANDFFSDNGKWFQGLDIAEPLPDNGNMKAPDYARTPTDQAQGWPTNLYPPQVASSLKIDTYAGKVSGWVATLSFTYDSDTWIKCHGYGDMSDMSHDWQILEN
jgi:hypothetical protein